MSDNLTLFDKIRIFGKLKGLQSAMSTKNSTKIILAVIAVLTAVAETGWAQHFIQSAILSHPGIAVALVGIVKVILTLHTPQTDTAMKELAQSVAKTGLIVLLCVGFVLGIAAPVQAQQDALPTNVYAAGVSYNSSGASPAIAGTGMYARKVVDSGTYAFTIVDALPAGIKPFVVTTNFGFGVAQKIVTVSKVPVYIPTSAGISFNGTNTGWAWTTGAMVAVKVKGNWRVFPNLRIVKSSVSGGSGYQPIVGVMVGWGQ